MKYCPLCTSDLVLLEQSGLPRLSCAAEGCGYIFWDNPIPVVGAIVEHEGEIILANNVNWPEHWFSLITGFLEKDETPEQCVVREVKEELNLDSEKTEYVGLYSFFRLNQLIIAYHVRATGEIKLNEELRSYKRVKKDKVQPWDSETGHALRDWLISKGLYDESRGLMQR